MSVRDEFGSLFHSDLSCAGAESLQTLFMGWLTVSIAHFGIGLFCSAVVLFRGYSHRWLWAGVMIILVKEVAGDIPNGSFAMPVIADSIWDVACYFIGFFTLWGLMMSAPGGEA